MQMMTKQKRIFLSCVNNKSVVNNEGILNLMDFNKKPYKMLFMAMAGFLIASCSSNKTPPPVTYMPGGISISYTADKDLNAYDQSPHYVMLVIYQLDNISGFHQLAKNLTGINQLLNLSKFDSSVIGIDTRFINAGEAGLITLDRLENTKWIGLAAGYYDLTPLRSIKEVQMPKDVSDKLQLNLSFTIDTIQEVETK